MMRTFQITNITTTTDITSADAYLEGVIHWHRFWEPHGGTESSSLLLAMLPVVERVPFATANASLATFRSRFNASILSPRILKTPNRGQASLQLPQASLFGDVQHQPNDPYFPSSMMQCSPSSL